MELSKWPEVQGSEGGAEKRVRQKNLILVNEILNIDICLARMCSKVFHIAWNSERTDVPDKNLEVIRKHPFHLSSPHPSLATADPDPSLRVVGSCAPRPSHSEQMNWLNVYTWASLNTDFCFSVSRVTLSERWNGKLESYFQSPDGAPCL